MKKVFVTLLTAGVLFGMSACGGSTPPPAPEPEPQVEEVTPCDEPAGDEEAAETPAEEVQAE
jgi:predicted small lipoprotein YifL